MTELAAPRRSGGRGLQAGADGLGAPVLAAFGIIDRLRHPRAGACRHFASRGGHDGTRMRHYIFGPTPRAPLAITALPCRMPQRTAASSLVALAGPAQRLPMAQLRAPRRAVPLPSVTRTAHANRPPTASALKQPKALAHPTPARSAGQRPGEPGIKGLRRAPFLAHRIAKARGRVVSEPGPSFISISYGRQHNQTASGSTPAAHSRGQIRYGEKSRERAVRGRPPAIYRLRNLLRDRTWGGGGLLLASKTGLVLDSASVP